MAVTVLSGYSSIDKPDGIDGVQGSANATRNPVDRKRNGIDVASWDSTKVSGTGLVNLDSSGYVVYSAGHSVLVGDRIIFLDGTYRNYEFSVSAVEANSFTLSTDLPGVIANGVTYEIHRYTTRKGDAEGAAWVINKPEREYYINEDTKFQSFESPRSLDVFSGLGDRYGHTLMFSNDGAAGYIGVQVSDYGQTSYGSIINVYFGEKLEISGIKIAYVKLTRYSSDTAYRLICL